MAALARLLPAIRLGSPTNRPPAAVISELPLDDEELAELGAELGPPQPATSITTQATTAAAPAVFGGLAPDTP
jgi:hypothetical protein